MLDDPDLTALDIMLLDQLVRGRIVAGCRILDVGCGSGRNLRWFAKQGLSCHGIDPDPQAIAAARVSCPAAQFQIGGLPRLPCADERFDLIIVNAVLHFATDRPQFCEWFQQCAGCLAEGGRLFARLATRDCWPGDDPCDASGRVIDPHCPFGYLADSALLEQLAAEYQLAWADPLKTTVIHRRRTMSTVVLQA